MIAILSLLVTLTLSLLVTRVAAMALMLTGLSRESAKFQARSAFSGVGFTTGESESIVNHPVRRQIVMTLMLLGNVGIATVAATIMVSFVNAQKEQRWGLTLSILLGGVLMLWILARSRWVERHLNRLISWTLRRFGRLQVRDYVAVLHLAKGYGVSEMQVEPSDWLAAKTLAELALPAEGVLVLGIQRADGKTYIGAPTAQTKVQADDTLVLYGPIERIAELDQRRAGRRGDKAHQAAIDEFIETIEQEEREEREGTADDSEGAEARRKEPREVADDDEM